jgi:hypothetical protein
MRLPSAKIMRLAGALIVQASLALPLSYCARCHGIPEVWPKDTRACPRQYFFVRDDIADADAPLRWAIIPAYGWPLGGATAAYLFRRRVWVGLRLACEPLLIAGTLAYMAFRLLFNNPASGFFVGMAGVMLYLIAWLRDVVHWARSRPGSRKRRGALRAELKTQNPG